MLNRNRCIMCTRCARFMREVDGDAQIGIVDRGNGSEIATFNEQGVHSLLSGNLMDVCPVGAITTKQYRFRSRPWDNPNAVDTICTALLEGLRHHGLAEGQARVGQGLAARARHAALQPRGERLLDVRHRPLPVRLGRRRQPPPQAAGARPRRHRQGGLVEGRAASRPRPAQRRRPARSGVGALPGVGARQPRRALPDQADCRGAEGTGRGGPCHRVVAALGQVAAGDDHLRGAADRRAERARGARPRPGRRGRARRPRRPLDACAAPWTPGTSRSSTSSIPVRPSRSARSAGWSRRARRDA